MQTSDFHTSKLGCHCKQLSKQQDGAQRRSVQPFDRWHMPDNHYHTGIKRSAPRITACPACVLACLVPAVGGEGCCCGAARTLCRAGRVCLDIWHTTHSTRYVAYRGGSAALSTPARAYTSCPTHERRQAHTHTRLARVSLRSRRRGRRTAAAPASLRARLCAGRASEAWDQR